jgi:hypothetical protein
MMRAGEDIKSRSRVVARGEPDGSKDKHSEKYVKLVCRYMIAIYTESCENSRTKAGPERDARFCHFWRGLAARNGTINGTGKRHDHHD